MKTTTTTTITATKPTGTGAVTVSAEIDYEIPLKGDTIFSSGFPFKLLSDMKMGIDFDFNEETRKYEGSPARDHLGNIVFYGESVSWRKGEYFEKA